MNKILERTQKEINRERRRFLDMLGKAGVSTSLLKASTIAGAMMSSRYAEAAGESPKLILIYHPNGSPDGRWLPSTGTSACKPLQPHNANIAYREMTISSPGNHGNVQWAFGGDQYDRNNPRSSSFNFQVAKVVGNTTPYSSIELGVDTKGTQGGMNFLNGSSVPLEENPRAAFNRIFSSIPQSGGGGSSVDTAIYDQRLRVLDANKAALDALERKLGATEREKLGEHLAALEELEQRVLLEQQRAADSGDNNSGGACSAPTLNGGTSPLNIYRSQGDIAVSALKCGLTNVVSIQFNETQATWVPNDGTADSVNWAQDHHQANHANGTAFLPDIIGYMNKGVEHIISRLKAEGIFNQTVVCVASEMGDGQEHTAPNGPIIVATGLSGLKSGEGRSSSSHLEVFNDVAKLMGLSSSIGGAIANYGRGGHVA